MRWYISVLRRYADFSGRARRPEYWMFALINTIVVLGLLLADGALGTGFHPPYHSGDIGLFRFATRLGILSGAYSLAVLLPSLAVGVRRLHDTGRSGWWLLIGLVPYVGGIVVLVFASLAGTNGPNRYGADPTGAVGARPAW